MDEQMNVKDDAGAQSNLTVRLGTQVDLILESLIERLQARSDNAYCDFIGQMRRDECLGWEIKVERGHFGEAELKAHCAGAEKLGRHRAFHEAAKMLTELLSPNVE